MSILNNNEKKHSESVPAIHTLLGKGTSWKGEIHTGANSLRIEGNVEGTIHSEGEVTIAPSGSVNGTIHAKHLIVTGKAEGILKIIECLEIHGTGWVEGDVELSSLVVDEGGTLQGTCTRRGASKDAHGAAAAKATANGHPEEDHAGARTTTPQPLGGADRAAIGSAAPQRQKTN